MITEVFINEVSKLIINDIYNKINYIGVGSDGSSNIFNNNFLFNEVVRKQVISKNKKDSSAIFSFYLSNGEYNGNVFKEVGTFDNSVDGNMFSRNVINGFVKDSTKELWIDVEFKASG